MGYHQAGFTEIVGVDVVDQPNYPFEFVQADVLWGIDMLVASVKPDLIHASPPCQAYSFATIQMRDNDYPDLVAPTQTMLYESGLPYVIENVPGAPLGYSITICGSMFADELRVIRHRLFETSWLMMSPGCDHSLIPEPLTVIGHNEPGRTYRYVNGRERTLSVNLEARKEAMGIDWMTRTELSEAIPPAYTKFIGEAFIEQLVRSE